MSSQGVNIIAQLVLPPIFLRKYGVSMYGEWLTLSATVSYLSTLNFGLHTYGNNQVAIHYNRGEREQAHVVQATTLLLLLTVIASVALLTSVVFFLPINSWLGLQSDAFTVSATTYLLGLQVLGRMLFGFLAGIYLVAGVAYRGGYWNNFLALASSGATAIMAYEHVSFTWIAAQQAILPVLVSTLLLIHLRVTAPAIFPRLQYAQPGRFGEFLKPSSYFALLYASNFLVYQVPVLLTQRILGPTTVVVFSLSRTIFSMSRSLLASLTQAIGPEITELYGKRNWPRLFRLYELSERVVFALVPPISLGTLLIAPLLMAVWLRKPDLYNPYVCLLMALISAAIGIKEHKYHFQTSSNEHTILARLMFTTYVIMTALAVPALLYVGIVGFLALWFTAEVFLVLAIIRLNQRLFAGFARVNFSPVYKLFALMGGATVISVGLAIYVGQNSMFITALATILFIAAVLGIAFPLFDLREVLSYVRNRVSVTAEK